MLRRLTFLTLLLLTASLCHAEPPKKLLLLGQKPDGHPAMTHEYMPGQRLLAQCLAATKELECQIEQADEPWTAGPELLKSADGVVLFVSEGARWIQNDPRRLDAFDQLAMRGGGLVVLHWGMGVKDAAPIDHFLKLFGGCHGGPDRKFKVLDDVELRVADREHPVTHGIENFRLREELYYQLKFVKSEKHAVHPLLQASIDGQVETVAWSWDRPDGGRSCGFSGLHFHDNWRREEYRRLVSQAVLWSLKLPIPKDGLKVDLPAKAFE